MEIKRIVEPVHNIPEKLPDGVKEEVKIEKKGKKEKPPEPPKPLTDETFDQSPELQELLRRATE